MPAMRDARDEFPRLIAALAATFAADRAIASVNTDKYGTITRADVERLLPSCRKSLRYLATLNAVEG